MSDRMIFVCSHGKDDPERAIVAIAAASTAAIAGIPTAVLCTIEGVWLGTDGTEGREGRLPSLPELFAKLSTRGEVGCGRVARPRRSRGSGGQGAKIVAAAR